MRVEIRLERDRWEGYALGLFVPSGTCVFGISAHRFKFWYGGARVDEFSVGVIVVDWMVSVVIKFGHDSDFLCKTNGGSDAGSS